MSSLKELQTRLLSAAVLYRTLKAEKMKLFFDIGEPDNDCGFSAFLVEAKKLESVNIITQGIILLTPNDKDLKKMHDALWYLQGSADSGKGTAKSIGEISDFAKFKKYALTALNASAQVYNCLKVLTENTEVVYKKRIAQWINSRCQKAQSQWNSMIGTAASIQYLDNIISFFIDLETVYNQMPAALKNLQASQESISSALVALPDADFDLVDKLIEANRGSALTLVTNNGYATSLSQLEADDIKKKLRLDNYLAITQFFKSFMAVYPIAKQERALQPCGQPLLLAIQQALPVLQELAQLETASKKTTIVATINQWEAKYQVLQQIWLPFMNQATTGTRCEKNAIEINTIYNKYANQDWDGLRLIAGVQTHIDNFDTAYNNSEAARLNYAKNNSDSTTDLIPISKLVTTTSTLQQELEKVAKGLNTPNKMIDAALKKAVADLKRYTEIEAHLQMLKGIQSRLKVIDGVEVVAASTIQNLGMPIGTTVYDVSDASKYTLYIQDKKDAQAADANDIQQAGLGDCYYLATAAALAQNTKHNLFDPKTGIIEVITDGKKTIKYFRVKLHLSIGTGGAMKEVQVQVLPQLVANTNSDLLYHQMGDSQKKQQEIWGAVLEMALVQVYGSFKAAESGDSAFAFSLLTGKQAIRYFLNDANSTKEVNKILTELQTAANKGNYDITFSTLTAADLTNIPNAVSQPTANNTPDGNLIILTPTLSLFGNHVYTFKEINANGEITLLNPHFGTNKEQKVMLTNIDKYFSNITVYTK